MNRMINEDADRIIKSDDNKFNYLFYVTRRQKKTRKEKKKRRKERKRKNISEFNRKPLKITAGKDF